MLEELLRSVSDRVIKLDKRRFGAESDEMLAADIASELVVAPLELVEDDISVSSRDVKVDVSQDFRRAVFDRSRPAYVDGIEVTYHVPFRGEKKLLQCLPSRFTFNPPQAVIAPGELRFPVQQPDRDVASTKRSFEEELARVKEWLPWVNSQVEAYNSSVEAAARNRVAQRRRELEQTADDLSSLGFKVRTPEQAPKPTAPSRREQTEERARTRETARRTYDVALSFAGENRDYVEEVAEELRNLGVTVFYDHFEEVELWGKDLAEHLGKVYGSDARFVVLFLSRAYAAKAWPRHEKQFALASQISTGQERVLPVRFDDTEIPGLPSTVGYLDLRVLTPAKLAELIRQKVDRRQD
jgi:hypothetical protein